MQIPQAPLTQPLPTATIATAATTTSPAKDNTKTTLSIILVTSFFSLLFIFSFSSSSSSSSTSASFLTSSARPDPHLFPTQQPSYTKMHSDPAPPSIAYLISGSKGDSGRILRLLYATYHPKNHYLLHIDHSAPQTDRDRLALAIQKVPIFKAAQNVNVIGKADIGYPKGSSTISAMLHGAAILLRLSNNWDWLINLSAGDYPLVTQDDLLHILSYLPKDLNFVNHTSYIGWRESRKLKRIIVDPGLYLSEKTQMFYATQKRQLPNSFRIFTGTSFSILSRNFVEHCILGADNLPRILLMYFSNTPSSLANYFPTILCNSHQFSRTVINHSLKYVAFEQPFFHYWRLSHLGGLECLHTMRKKRRDSRSLASTLASAKTCLTLSSVKSSGGNGTPPVADAATVVNVDGLLRLLVFGLNASGSGASLSDLENGLSWWFPTERVGELRLGETAADGRLGM